MADEAKKCNAIDLQLPFSGPTHPSSTDPLQPPTVVPQPLASVDPSALLNNYLQPWGFKRANMVSMSSSGLAHLPTWSAATNPTSLLQFDPPAKTFTSLNKNAAAREYHQSVLLRVQAADLLGRQFAPGDFMRSVSVSDDANFIDLCTDQAVAGRALT
jgi:hypothetical protein